MRGNIRPKGIASNSNINMILLFAGAILLIGTLSIQADPLIIFDMQDFATQELRSVKFEIDVQSHLNVSIIGARYRNQDQMYAYGWIIDADSREVVWSMSEANTRRVKGEKTLRKFKGTIDLPRGAYEAFYYEGSPFVTLSKFNYNKDIEDFSGIVDYFGNVFQKEFGDDARNYSEQKKKYRFTLDANTNHFKIINNKKDTLPNQVLSIVKPRNLSDAKIGFTVAKDLNLMVYAIGEYSENGDVFMDGAKIINADTREKVWAMERWNTDWGGGSLKNRCFHDNIKLSRGQYILYYWTDDSHTYDDWNGSPPYDPNFWGVTLMAESEGDVAFVKQSDIENRKQVLVQIVKVGDSANLEKTFKLKKKIKINIYAIGEGKKDYMYDYGWIVNLKDSSIVWKMKERETDHAGGASKNRVFDGIIELASGNYALHYKSDGSHSYRSWNEAQPSDPRHYGITLYAYDRDYNPGIIEVGELKSGKQNVKYPGDVSVEKPSNPHISHDNHGIVIVQNNMRNELMILRRNNEKILHELIQDMKLSMVDSEKIEALKEQFSNLNDEYLDELEELVDDMDSKDEDSSNIKDLQQKAVELKNDYLDELRKIRKDAARHTFQKESPLRKASGGYLVKMNALGDNENLKSTFTLSKPSRIRIYAIGEGMGGKMYDYGWLVSKETGNIIWEMTYRKTYHAGGALKNRIVDDIIMLDKGEYEAYFVTDDSHSYDGWNATHPDDERGWGMTIKLIEK